MSQIRQDYAGSDEYIIEMANLSMKELSKEHVKNTFDMYTKHLKPIHFGGDKKAYQSAKKSVKQFMDNNGFDIMIARDEGGQSSIIDKLENQIKKEQDSNKALANDMLNNQIGLDADGNKTWAKDKDLSEVDSYLERHQKHTV